MLTYKAPKRARRSEIAPAPFIVGCGRSGTTLLRMILDAHPDLAIPPETAFIPQVVRASRGAADPRSAFLDVVLNHPRWDRFMIEADVLRERINTLEPFTISDAVRTFYRLHAEHYQKPRWGDKTPRYGECMTQIQRLLPEARFIHIIRDGRDVALSAMSFETMLAPKSMIDLAGWWYGVIASVRAQVDGVKYYLEVRYEDLALNTETTLRRLCDYLELPWTDALLNYHVQQSQRAEELYQKFGHLSREESRGERAPDWRPGGVMRPINKERVSRWRRDMVEPDRASFETIAGDLLVDLGYPIGAGAADQEPVSAR